MKEKIYLTKEGYDKYITELENMRKELANKLNSEFKENAASVISAFEKDAEENLKKARKNAKW